MRKRFFNLFVAAILLFSLAGVSPANKAVAATGDFTMTVFHTNDTHAHLGNFAKRASLVKKLRGENQHNLLLDAGDVFSGTLYFNEFKGQADLAAMNYLEYDAMTFGNHEFDLGGSDDGHQALVDFIKGANFPLVAANVDFSADELFDGLQTKEVTDKADDGHIYNGIIKEVNGEKVGIFGLTTEETADISQPRNVTFSNYITEAKAAVAAFEKAGVNKIIALTHIGYNDSDKIDNDLLLAKNVPGIDIIVGGHTHTKLDEPVVVNDNDDPVVIVQANSYNNHLGQLDVTFDANGVITSYEGVLHAVADVKDEEASDKAAELMKEYDEQVDAVKNTPTKAKAGVFLSGLRSLGGVRTAETNLGNVITDGMLAKAQEIDPEVVLSFQNGGGIRTSIPKGTIMYGKAIEVMPFANSLAIMSLSGEELKAVFEHSVKDYPNESGGFLHIAGMKLVFDGEAEAGNRVLSMKVNGKEIEMDKMYKVATNVFTATGGDGYDMLKAAYEDGRGSEPGFMDWENFVTHMNSLGTVNTGLEGRIIAKTPFKDMNVNNWSYQYVADLYYRDLVKGTSENRYSPKRNLTRAQAASLIVRALELTADEAAPFNDIGHYADETQQEIAAAYAAGIVKGSGGNFMPGDNVTRAQLALMIERAYEYHTKEQYTAAGKAPYSDYGKYNAETVNAISMLYELGIATGSAGKYMPGKYTTREQAAKVLSNLLYSMKQHDN